MERGQETNVYLVPHDVKSELSLETGTVTLQSVRPQRRAPARRLRRQQ